MRALIFAIFALLISALAPADAQVFNATVVSSCGTPPTTYTAGRQYPLTQDTTGSLCTTGTAVSLAPGTTSISPSTNGGVLYDNNGVLGDSTTLPASLTFSNANGPTNTFTNTSENRSAIVGMLDNFNAGIDATGGGNIHLRINGTTYFNVGTSITASLPIIASSYLSIGSTTPATASAGEIASTKISASGSAPGAGYAKMEWVAGTNGGTCKLIAYAGTSTTPTTIIDNVGGGC